MRYDNGKVVQHVHECFNGAHEVSHGGLDKSKNRITIKLLSGRTALKCEKIDRIGHTLLLVVD